MRKLGLLGVTAAAAALFGCGGSSSSEAHVVYGQCVADLNGCPATFADVPCSAPLGSVGRCVGDILIYTYGADLPGHIGDYPAWLCFYDPETGRSRGQRMCVEDPAFCGDSYCVQTPGTPYCDSFLTTLVPPSCGDNDAI